VVQRIRSHRLSEWLIASCGVWCIAIGLYFIFLRPAFLPEDLRYMGIGLAELQAKVPGLNSWLDNVFTVMGGFMAGGGALIAYLGWVVLPLRLPGIALLLAISGSVSLGLMSAVNFSIQSDFRWVLVAPTAIWVVAIVVYIVERRK
jgi:hypothetical protein